MPNKIWFLLLYLDNVTLFLNRIKNSFHFFQCFSFCFRNPFPCEKDDENYKELIFIKYDPSIFEYEYDDSEDPDDWSDWADRLHSTDLGGSISETLDEHSDQIRWNDYLGDNIYMSSNDINNYLNDIL